MHNEIALFTIDELYSRDLDDGIGEDEDRLDHDSLEIMRKARKTVVSFVPA